jgi:hypothetical protein
MSGEDTGKTLFEKVLLDAEVELSSSDKVLMIEAMHKVRVADKRPQLRGSLIDSIELTINRVLDTNPKLKPFSDQIIDSFVVEAKQEEMKTLLSKKLKKTHTHSEQQTQESTGDKTLDKIVQELINLTIDSRFTKQIGPKNAEEFAQRVGVLNDEYIKAPENERSEKLLENLDILKIWSEKKERELQDSVFNAVSGVIVSFASAVGALINRDKQAIEKHMQSASEAIGELINSKGVSKGLGSVKEKTQSWKNKIIQEQVAKEQNESKTR